MKRTIAILMAVMSIFCLGGILYAADKRPSVALVLKSLSNEHWKKVEEGARKFAKEDGTFDFTVVGMNSETDIDTQINAIENLISKKVDVMVFTPADSVGVARSIKKAIDAGIIAVGFDTKLEAQAMKDNDIPEDLIFLGPDDAKNSYGVGKLLGEKIGKGAKVVILEGSPGQDIARLRQSGLIKAAEEYNFDILASTTAHWELEEANTVMTNLLTAHPDIQGVMTHCDAMSLGAIRAIEAAHKMDQIVVVGFDNQEPAQRMIKDGKMYATVDQFGPLNAIEAIKVGLRILDGEKITGYIQTPGKVVTIEDLK
jgi:ribose transport system substrate-binding protein